MMTPTTAPGPALSRAASPPSADPVRLKAVAGEMRKYLSDFDSAAADCLNANRHLLSALFSPEEFIRFEKRIESYDFAEAQVQLELAMKDHSHA